MSGKDQSKHNMVSLDENAQRTPLPRTSQLINTNIHRLSPESPDSEVLFDESIEEERKRESSHQAPSKPSDKTQLLSDPTPVTQFVLQMQKQYEHQLAQQQQQRRAFQAQIQQQMQQMMLLMQQQTQFQNNLFQQSMPAVPPLGTWTPLNEEELLSEYNPDEVPKLERDNRFNTKMPASTGDTHSHPPSTANNIATPAEKINVASNSRSEDHDRITELLVKLTEMTLHQKSAESSSVSNQAGIQRMMKMEPIKEWDPKVDPFFYIKNAVATARQAYHDVKTTKELLLLGNPTHQEKLQNAFQRVYEEGTRANRNSLSNEWFVELRRAFVQCLDAKKYQETRMKRFTFEFTDASLAIFDRFMTEFYEVNRSIPSTRISVDDRIEGFLSKLRSCSQIYNIFDKLIMNLDTETERYATLTFDDENYQWKVFLEKARKKINAKHNQFTLKDEKQQEKFPEINALQHRQVPFPKKETERRDIPKKYSSICKFGENCRRYPCRAQHPYECPWGTECSAAKERRCKFQRHNQSPRIQGRDGECYQDPNCKRSSCVYKHPRRDKMFDSNGKSSVGEEEIRKDSRIINATSEATSKATVASISAPMVKVPEALLLANSTHQTPQKTETLKLHQRIDVNQVVGERGPLCVAATLYPIDQTNRENEYYQMDSNRAPALSYAYADSGNTFTCIRKEFAIQNNLPILIGPPLEVTAANGESLSSNEYTAGVIKLGSEPYELDHFPLFRDLSHDVIIGNKSHSQRNVKMIHCEHGSPKVFFTPLNSDAVVEVDAFYQPVSASCSVITSITFSKLNSVPSSSAMQIVNELQLQINVPISMETTETQNVPDNLKAAKPLRDNDECESNSSGESGKMPVKIHLNLKRICADVGKNQVVARVHHATINSELRKKLPIEKQTYICEEVSKNGWYIPGIVVELCNGDEPIPILITHDNTATSWFPSEVIFTPLSEEELPIKEKAEINRNDHLGKLFRTKEISEKKRTYINALFARHRQLCKKFASGEARFKTLPKITSLQLRSEVKPEEMELLKKQINQELKEEEKEKLLTLLIRHKDVFFAPVGRTSLLKHSIELDTTKAIFTPDYPRSLKEIEAIEEQVQLWLKQGVIEYCDESRYNSPLVCVKKKDGGLRLCIDFRAINKHTLIEPQFMPIPNDLFNKIGAAKPNYLSVMDISQGYLNIEMKDEDKEKTAFTTTSGRYQFLRMIFGLSGAPFTFIKLMQRVLAPLANNVLAFVDDCILFDKSFDNHLTNLNSFFNRIRECGLSVKLQKGNFGYQKLPFLGHIIGKEGLEMEPQKCKEALDFPQPKTPKEVQRFLGFINYYGDFIPNLAGLRAPFDKSIMQRRVIWNDELHSSFREIKSNFKKDQILSHFDPNKKTFLTMDACNTQVSGVLSQLHFIDNKWIPRPIRFVSKKLSTAQMKWSTFDKELYAIVIGVKKNYRYLYGHPFTVFTDHRPLEHFDSIKLHTYDQVKVRHALFLSEFTFKIFHITGKENVVADYMTRATLKDTISDEEAQITLKQESNFLDPSADHPMCASLKLSNLDEEDRETSTAIKIPNEKLEKERKNYTSLSFWKEHQEKDSYIISLKNYLNEFRLPDEEEVAAQVLKDAPLHQVIDDIVYCCTNKGTKKRNQILVPSHLQQAIVALHHNTLTAAHPGVNYTTERIDNNFTWARKAKSIAEHIAGCKLCQQRKAAKLKLRQLHQPFEKPTRFWQQLAIDTIGPIKKNYNSHRSSN